MLRIIISESFNEVRTWEINEYYIFIPLSLLVDYFPCQKKSSSTKKIP
jgi:hypothetical protein